MQEYRGFRFDKKAANRYRLVYPSGFKTYVAFETDTEVKDAIDQIIILFSGE